MFLSFLIVHLHVQLFPLKIIVVCVVATFQECLSRWNTYSAKDFDPRSGGNPQKFAWVIRLPIF